MTTGWAKKQPVEALLMEVNCYKLAQNRGFEDCLAGVAAAMLHLAAENTDGSVVSWPAWSWEPRTGAVFLLGPTMWCAQVKFLTQLKAQLGHWKKLMGKLTQVCSLNVFWSDLSQLLLLRLSYPWFVCSARLTLCRAQATRPLLLQPSRCSACHLLRALSSKPSSHAFSRWHFHAYNYY